MAGEEDGSEFIGIDDRAFGDGQTDATTRPVSMGLENRIDGNLRNLWAEAPGASLDFYAPAHRPEVEPRPYTSLGWMYLAYIPFEIVPSVETIRVRLQTSITHDDENITGEMEARLVLRGAEREIDGTITSWISTAGVAEYVVELDLSDATLRRQAAGVGLQIRSAEDVQLGSATAPVTEWAYEYPDGGTMDGFISDKVGVYDQSGTPIDIIHKSTTGGDDEHTSGIHIPDVEYSELTNETDVYQLSYLTPYAGSIEIDYDEDAQAPGAGYLAKPPREMQAQEPVAGAGEVGGHGRNLDAIYQRPKLMAVGPHGQDSGVDWPADQHRQFCRLNASSSGYDPELDRQNPVLRHKESTVRCIVYLAGFWQLDPIGAADFIKEAQVVSSADEYINEWTILADIYLKVTISGLSAGAADWSGATKVGAETVTERNFPLHKFDLVSVYPLARQSFWARHPDGWTDEASEYRYTYKEGTLREKDTDLLPPNGIAIDVPVTVGVDGVPIRCDLEFAGFDSAPSLNGVDFQGSASASSHLACVGTSWWEIPQL